MKNFCSLYNAGLNKIGLVKLIEYGVSTVHVWFNPCVGPLPRIKKSFPLLSMCTDELISAPKIITF